MKSYETTGKFLLCFSILVSLFLIIITFTNDSFIQNLPSKDFSISLWTFLGWILCIIGGFSLKNKYPKYYKYQVLSGVILLATLFICDIIPRLIYSIY